MLKKLIGIAAMASVLAMASVAEAGSLKLGHSTWVGYGPLYIPGTKASSRMKVLTLNSSSWKTPQSRWAR